MKAKISWPPVDSLTKGAYHGVEIYYNDNNEYNEKNLVACVVGFDWWHGESDFATVQILQTNSERYFKLGVDGKQVKQEVQRAVRKYVPERKPFPHFHMGPEDGRRISKRLTVWVNG
jgi:hypothetical protein